MADLEVRSPIDGQVVTWDLENRLLHRPVQRGQVLLRVANPDGDWQLELHMAEDRMGHIARAAAAGRAATARPLPVSYILATAAGHDAARARSRRSSRSPRSAGEEGNTVLIKVASTRTTCDRPTCRPGATVTAKVYCGRRSLGYVWFHDLLAFVQSRILFRL